MKTENADIYRSAWGGMTRVMPPRLCVGRYIYIRYTVILRQSAFLMAMTAPRIRYAAGSPAGLLPTHLTFVFSIIPISSRRRRIPLPASMRHTCAHSPGPISERQHFSFIMSDHAFHILGEKLPIASYSASLLCDSGSLQNEAKHK